jgi:hypothetical protein
MFLKLINSIKEFFITTPIAPTYIEPEIPTPVRGRPKKSQVVLKKVIKRKAK